MFEGLLDIRAEDTRDSTLERRAARIRSLVLVFQIPIERRALW